MLLERDPRSKARPGDGPHMLQNLMDIDRLARQRPAGKHFHAVNQGANAIGLVANEPGQWPVPRAGVALEELGGAANARKRILDFMRQ